MKAALSLDGRLFYVEYQSFKIFTLRVIDVDGVVGRLVELVEDAHLASSLSRCGKHRLAEMLLAYHL